MNRNVIASVFTATISALLLAESAHFAWLSWFFAELFRSSTNVTRGDPLPEDVWTYALEAAALVCLAVVYFRNALAVRRWFVVVAGFSLVYGVSLIAQNYPIMFAWSGVLRGDLVAIEVWSGIGFVVLGVLGALARLTQA